MRTYELSKRKEHAFIDQLTDEKIKIFCCPDEEAETLIKQQNQVKETT